MSSYLPLSCIALCYFHSEIFLWQIYIGIHMSQTVTKNWEEEEQMFELLQSNMES